MRITMKNYALLSALLLAVVFLSGCIGQPPTTGVGKGLSIKGFASDFPEVRSGETITLSALVENVGDADAYNVKAQLFGLNIGSEWSIQDQDKSSTRMIGQQLSGSALRRADSALGLPGESYEFTWTVKAPADLRVDNTYTASLRTYYKYKTSSTSILHLVSYDYLKSLPTDQFNTEKAKAGVTQSTSSAAPVSVKLSAGIRPLVVYSNGDSFSVQIDLTNVDSGNAFDTAASYPQLGSADLHKVYIAIAADGDLGFTCSGLQGYSGATWVSLTKGQSKTVFCTIKGDKAKLENSRDYTVTVTLDYGYYIDASTAVKVLKSELPLGVSGTSGTTASTSSTTSTTMLPGGWSCAATGSCASASDCPPVPPSYNQRDCISGRCCYK